MPASVVALGMTALGWLASPVIKDLFEKSKAFLGRDFRKGLEDLDTILLPLFQLAIKDVQDRSDAERLDKWLARLKNAYYSAEAILHDIQYDCLRRQVEDAEKKKKKKKLWVRISTYPIIKSLAMLTNKVGKKLTKKRKNKSSLVSKKKISFSLSSTQKKELWQRLKELKEVAAEVNTTFSHLPKIQASDENHTSASGSCPTTGKLAAGTIFGRDEVRDEIIEFLLKEQDVSRLVTNRHVTVAITGGGGDGKTTLVQYVYDDQEIKKHFGDRRIWLSLSHQNDIDINMRTTEMIQCLSPEETCSGLLSETLLQEKLQKKLMSDSKDLPNSQPVLLVLDDVWYENNQTIAAKWKTLLKPFGPLERRCKIVITSRSNSFPDDLYPGKHILLKHLAYDDFQKLFMHHAMHKLESDIYFNQLRNIANQIAKKMSKSPLAAIAIGNELRKKPDPLFWRRTLNNVNVKDITEVLQWSYERLDAQLQRCFLFFAVFPKGSSRFTASEMVQYWVALDFIQHKSTSSDDNKSVEDIGFECFNKLVANSILCQSLDGWYTMHDLYHDLAERLSAGDRFEVTDSDQKTKPKDTVLHVFVRVNKSKLKEKLHIISELPNLRTLIVANRVIEDEDMRETVSMISTKFKNLRVLEIWSHGYRALPKMVGDLRNLRCLKVHMSSLQIEELPDSVSQLYHLQFLILPESIKTLPVKLSNLINLRSIEMHDNKLNLVYTLPPIQNLGNLTLLQNLPEFHVRNEEGYEVGQLESLREIRGSLRIVGLENAKLIDKPKDGENIRDKDEVVEAKLIDKPKLESLELMWGESAEGESEDVIEALRPTGNLQFLTIDGYKGSSYPTWLATKGFFLHNLTHITFRNCSALPSLPPNCPRQFLYCSKLVLENLGALRELSTFPKELSTLIINKCSSLILVHENELLQVVDVKQLMVEQQKSSILAISDKIKCIVEHEIKSFEQTGSVENCPEQLRTIHKSILSGIILEVPFNTEYVGLNEWESREDLQDVEDLFPAWWSCHQQRLNFIFGGNNPANKLKLPLGLRILELRCCCISNEALSACLGGMTNLEELHLEGIMTLTTLPPKEVLQSLENLRILEIKECWCLRSLNGLHALPQLQKFQVRGCNLLQVTCADELPSTLQSFDISGCKLLRVRHYPDIQDGKDDMLSSIVEHAFLTEFEGSRGIGHAQFPPSLQSIEISTCLIDGNILSGYFPYLHKIVFYTCPSIFFLRLGELPSLKELILLDCPNIISFTRDGLTGRLFLDILSLALVPDLSVSSVVECCQGCKELYVNSLVMLNKLLSYHYFCPPQILRVNLCHEEAVKFHNSNQLRSIRILCFNKCKIKNLPESLGDFSVLESIYFEDCPKISEMPILPDSVKYVEISGCPVLKERCQPNGSDWQKIQRIPYMSIK